MDLIENLKEKNNGKIPHRFEERLEEIGKLNLAIASKKTPTGEREKLTTEMISKISQIKPEIEKFVGTQSKVRILKKEIVVKRHSKNYQNAKKTGSVLRVKRGKRR